MIAPTLDCGGGGDCPDGEECLPSDYVAPCDEGSECLPDNYIDPADCPGSSCDYTPYCLNANADDPETVIIGLGPWAYYPMDDASGLPVDASGNGRDVSSVGGGTITYSAAPITNKRTASIDFEGGYFVLPKPFNVDSGNDWSVVWLEHVQTFQGAGSPAQPSALFGESNGSTPAAFSLLNTSSGDLYILWGSAGGQNFASYAQNADLIGRPSVIALVALPGTQPRMFIDGVCWGAAQNTGLIGPTNLCIGASDNGFWGYPHHRMSDFAFFDRGLTRAEVVTITEALADTTLFASSITVP